MAYVITSLCVGVCDTACVDVCPTDCIAGPVPVEDLRATPPEVRSARYAGVQLYVDPDECIDCGACLPVCPAGAIFHEDDLPPEHGEAAAANAAFFGRRP